MGKIVSASHLGEKTFKDITKTNEVISLSIHAVLMVALCLFFPLLSAVYVNPLISEMFGTNTSVLSDAILYTLVLIIVIVFAVPVIAYIYSTKIRVNTKLSYMNGVNAGDNRKFVDSMGDDRTLWLSNFYFHKTIGQRKLMIPSQVFSLAVLVIMMCMIIGGVLV